MTNPDTPREPAELTDEELRAQACEPLPNREAMSVITPDVQTLPPVLIADGDDVNPI